jgi:hypothetical protein
MGDDTTGGPRSRIIGPRDRGFHVHLALEERALLAAAAEASSMPVGPWIRHQALRAAAGISLQPEPLRVPGARHSREKLIYRFTVCFNATEHEAIIDHARACGMTIGGLIRSLVHGCKPMVRHPHLRSAIAAVHRAGDNLRQLVDLASTGSPLAPDLMCTAVELRAEIHALRDALLRADAAGAPDLAE